MAIDRDVINSIHPHLFILDETEVKETKVYPASMRCVNNAHEESFYPKISGYSLIRTIAH